MQATSEIVVASRASGGIRGFWRRAAGALVAATGIALATTLPPGGALSAQTGCDPLTSNPIVCENQLPGTPPAEWDVSGAGDPAIQGFTTELSVAPGDVVRFKVDTSATAFLLDIYRMGYYGGLGARKVDTVTTVVATNQDACDSDAATGLIDCGNWTESASWQVPATAVSGIYFAKATRLVGGVPEEDGSHIVFVVRDDTGDADILFQTSDTTWQAYNSYGGNSLYTGNPAGRAYKVSYNRPFDTRGHAEEDWVFNAEYPMVRWLERNGFDVSYATGIDSDRRGVAALQRHKVFLSVGHDEYWSGGQRANVEAARDAGVHLAFFSGNEVFWKTRWENSIDGSNTPYRTLVCYKETHANAKIDPSPEWTGTWRDPRFSPPSDGGRPENALTGTIFMVNDGATTAIQVPQAFSQLRFWRNTSIASLQPGQTATLEGGTLGYEWDSDLDNGFRPPGLVRLSSRTVTGAPVLQDYGSTYGSGTATHNLTLYRSPESGALVFGAGTVQWSWGLDENHDRAGAGAAQDVRMQQATVNLLADMGAQPLTLQANLTPATASTDTLPPSSTITSPADGATLTAGTQVTITGTAQDVGGGVVAGVEVSVDGGATWTRANGTTTWSLPWTPSGSGSRTIRSRAFDDSGFLETPSAGVTVTIGGGGGGECPCSIWSPSAVPANPSVNDPNAVELGVKFRSSADGFITSIRYYKSSQNTGTHVGNLWTTGGVLLASATFVGESGSGWQQVDFASPVSVSANTTYIASYHTPTGFYAGDNNYFATAVTNGPLTALADGTDGGNGVYRYGASGFPTSTFQSSNYWVDVVFVTSVGPDTTPPTVSSVTPGNGVSGVSTTTSVSVVFSEAMDAATIDTATIQLSAPDGSLVPSGVTWSAGIRTATLTPSSGLLHSTTYTVTVRGGTTDPRVKDLAGNALASTFISTFTTEAPPPPPPDEGPGGPILVVASSGNPFTRYYAEILRTEGLNAFTVTDVSLVTPATLASYDVVIVGQMPLSAAQVTMFSDWVNSGGNLIAMRPDKQLAGLLGLTDGGTTLSNAYLLVDVGAAPGAGIVGETIQFHGTADRYDLNGAQAVAMLYANATTATSSPAVTVRTVGAGRAAAFTYDLARSVVLTRQGNPAWSGQERDGFAPIRSDDLFFGAASGDPQPDWVNLDKVAIPQADEQQRLLANLIGFMNFARRPLPRFWYFPRGEKAVVVMTGDDHGNGGTATRFDIYRSYDTAGCSVSDWECVRSTSYVYPGTPITDGQVAAYQADGFEVGLHVNTGCSDWTPSSLQSDFESQLAQLASQLPSMAAPATNRTHCIVWSDYVSQAQVSLANGIRLDTNYYYWPPEWLNDRPGFFTGSGMPMRFATATGVMIDVYQATTQMTDESGQSYPFTPDALLDRALGPQGYYGAFTANMHTDQGNIPQSDEIVLSAIARGVPIVSARQMLTWLDGRNGSSFGNLSWSGTTLSFTVAVGAGANRLTGMVPADSVGGTLSALRRNGSPVAFSVETIKGVDYAMFEAVAGDYEAIYSGGTATPTLSIDDVTVAEGNSETTPAVFTVTLSAASSQTVTVNYATADGTATGGSDYTAGSGTLTFPAGTTTQAFTVPVTGDTLAEPDETFTVTLSNAANATLGDATATGTITNDDGTATLSIDDVTVAEGNAGTANAIFTVTLSAASGQPVTVDYATADDTATAGSDYTAATGTLTFAPGTTTQTLTVSVTGDTLAEPNETFTVALSNATNATIADPTGAGTITNDDGTPTLSINDATVAEGNAGTANATFTVTLSAPSGQTVTVDYATADDTATAGSDYTAATGTLTFAPGTTTQTLTVSVAGDTLAEPNETFTVGLTNPTGAGIVDASGLGTITNDDGTPTLSINDVTVAEGNAGTTNATFTVTLSAASGQPVTVDYATADGTATAGSDYTTASGTLTFAPGETTQTIPVPIAGDTLSEGDETFTMGLTNPTGAGIVDASGLGTITNDDGTPTLSIDDVTVAEGNAGTANATFTVTLSAASGQAVTVNYGTADVTATAGTDYTAASGTLTFAPGSTSQTIAVPVIGDAANEANETFTVTLTGPTGAAIAKAQGAATILDDDPPPTMSIDSPTVTEGRAGNTKVRFTVTLAAASGQAVTAAYATSDGTATAPSDYTAISGTVTFAPGTTSQTITVDAKGDSTAEPDETFFVTLSNPQNATVVQAQGTGTIINDDGGAASLSINSVSIAEGHTGATNAVFTVTLSTATSQTVTVAFATSNGTATAGTDYTEVSGTLTLPAGTLTQTISVSVLGDTVVESNETFTVNLSGATNAVIGQPQGTGTITNDDVLPSLSIDSVSVNEGHGGQTDAVFTVTLSAAAGDVVTVNYATGDGTATAGTDYVPGSGTVTFPAGAMTRTIAIPVLGDTLAELDETFTVTLSNEANATIAQGQGTGTITNDDVLPTLSINSVSITEGNGGQTAAIFTVTLSAAAGEPVTVNYATADGSATAGLDYSASSGSVTFAAGTVTQTINVEVLGDTTVEPDETFTVTLSSPAGATIAQGQGTATITNDDDVPPSLAINSVVVTEGDSGQTNAMFTVTLSAAAAEPVTVTYATSDGSALAGSDYTAASGTLTFPVGGALSQTISVPVLGDTIAEPNETFTVTLSAPAGAIIAQGQGTATITNDDGVVPSLSIDSVSVAEGDSGTTSAVFTVTLSAPSDQTVSVGYSTADGTALAGADYSAAAGTLEFQPGTVQQSITVPVVGDTEVEPHEMFTVSLSGATNATIAQGQGSGTITNDDAPPTLSIDSVSVLEGDSGTTAARFSVTLSAPSSQVVSVNYATASGTAGAGSDFTSTVGTLVFPAGSVTQTVDVPVVGDTVVEPDESFTVTLSDATNATITQGQATGTILNDDEASSLPALSINDLSVTEGRGGKTKVRFTVTLSEATSQTVTVAYATVNGTATAGSDYAFASGSVTIGPGATSSTVTVDVLGDRAVEPDETFIVTLSSPSQNATLGDAQGLCTIVNDD